MKRIYFFAVLFSLICALVSADGGDRKITAAEKAFMKKAFKQVTELLPAPAEGSEKKLATWKAPNSLGLGTERYPIYFSSFCEYVTPQDNAKIMKIAKDIDSGSMEEMSNQINKISEELQAAAEAGNSAKVMELQEKIQAVMSGNSSMAQMQNIVKEQENQTMNVEFSINPNGSDYFRYKEIPAPANCSYAIRRLKSEDANKTFVTADTVLFFGSFDKKLVDETYQIYAPRVEAQSQKIHRLIICFRGEAELADKFIARTNLAALAALTK